MERWTALAAARIVAASAWACGALPALAADGAPPTMPASAAARLDRHSEPVRIPRVKEPPVVDGRLDEQAWLSAAVFSDFYQVHPGDNIAPSQPTEVRMAYDERALYVAFRAFDAEPRGIRATLAKRDSVVADDYVGIFLDTFNDRRQAYELIFNPLGVQQDGIFVEGRGVLNAGSVVGVAPDGILTVGSTEDWSFDVVMESKGALTPDGYVVEVAIPLRSLRFDAGKGKSWGVHFFRRIKRFDDELDSWMPIARDRSGTLGQAGLVTGLENVSEGRAIDVIPSLVLSQVGRRERFVSPGSTPRFVRDPAGADPGLTARMGFSPGVAADLAVNPDFAQVEADQLVVPANERFPIFFPEKRPFFLEGREVFQTPLNALHTRAIVHPAFAAKLTLESGPHAFGALAASDDAPGDFTKDELANPANRDRVEKLFDKNAYVGALRYQRDVGKDSKLGLIATISSFVERHNQTAGVDATVRIDKRQLLTVQALGTRSRRAFYDPAANRNQYRTGLGLGYFLNYSFQSRHVHVNLNGEGRSSDFRTDIGFARRLDSNSWTFLGRYESDKTPGAGLTSWSTQARMLFRFNWHGQLQNVGPHFQTIFNLKRQTQVRLFGFFGTEKVFEEEFGPRRSATQRGAFDGLPYRRAPHKAIGLSVRTTPGKKLSFGIDDVGWSSGIFDFDLGALPRFARVSPGALLDPRAARDPGQASQLNLSTSVSYQPTDGARISLGYKKTRQTRWDTDRVAFDSNIYSLTFNWQFSAATFTRLQLDYDTLSAGLRGQLLLGFTPSPGTSVYIGLNEDLTSPNANPSLPLRRNRQTLFVKASYLLRRRY